MKRIVVTRPKSQANAMITGLIAAGFQPIEFPVIEIHRLAENTGLERALSRLECYDWMVFTSTNAVDAVWEQMSRLGIGQIPANVRIAAIGPKTAGILSAHGMEPSFIPSKYTAEAIMPGLGDLRGRWVLLPRSEIARKVLPDAIVTAGGVAHEIVVYRTLPAEADIAGVAALKEGVDVITFTSTSTVENFVQILHQNGLDPFNLPGRPKVVCIGPVTQKVAEDVGFEASIVAENYTVEGMIDAIRKL